MIWFVPLMSKLIRSVRKSIVTASPGLITRTCPNIITLSSAVASWPTRPAYWAALQVSALGSGMGGALGAGNVVAPQAVSAKTARSGEIDVKVFMGQVLASRPSDATGLRLKKIAERRYLAHNKRNN